MLSCKVPPRLDVAYYESGYDVQLTKAFHCDVPALSTLWKKAQRTLYVNMRDNFMDCPDRERSQLEWQIQGEIPQKCRGLAQIYQ